MGSSDPDQHLEHDQSAAVSRRCREHSRLYKRPPFSVCGPSAEEQSASGCRSHCWVNRSSKWLCRHRQQVSDVVEAALSVFLRRPRILETRKASVPEEPSFDLSERLREWRPGRLVLWRSLAF